MMEWSDTSPEIRVQDARYQRLLGYPRHHTPGERAVKLMTWARDWYARNGRPWIYARQAEKVEIGHGMLDIEGSRFTGGRILQAMLRARAHGAILAAVGAGPELEQEAKRLWQEEKPDEYFFLEVYGSAVVEDLLDSAGARFRAWAESTNAMVLPHYSPGYAEWDVAEQGRLLTLLAARLPSRVEALESGALRPKKSQLAVFGLAAWDGQTPRHLVSVPCYSCSLTPCEYRRTPSDKDESGR